MKKKLLSTLFLIAMVYSLGFSQSVLKDIVAGTGGSYPHEFFEYNGNVYFGTNNNQFWISDGTEAGTVLVKDVDFASDEVGYIIYDGMIYFNGNDGVLNRQLWKSDGTTDGTVLVKEIYPGNSAAIAHFEGIDGKIVFRAQNGGADGMTNGNHELWVSDGTTDGTTLLKEINPTDVGSLIEGTTLFNGKVYFVANDGTNGLEPWVTDGTTDGTMILKDISDSDNSEPSESKFTVWGDKLVFTAESDEYGIETWITDGTTDGTQILKDIAPGTDNSGPSFYTPNGGTMFFKAGDAGANYGKELWKTDGTVPGTVMVKDINEGSSGSGLENFILFGNKLYFEANDNTFGGELWVSDGTTDGTYMLRDIYPGSSGSYPYDFFKIKDKLFFMANDGTHGTELWQTDGTYQGTHLVKDIIPGTTSFYYNYPRVVGNHLYFRGQDDIYGYEPWHANILNFTVQPESAYEVVEGTTQVFTIEALGEGTITYRWQKDGVDIVDTPTKSFSGATTNELTIADASESDQGKYTCVVSDEFYGDIKSDVAVLSYEAFVSVNDVKSELKIYPNPANSIITISSADINNNRLFINNMTGKVIFSQTISGQKITIDVSSFSKGVYFITIKGENTIREKFIKQ